MTEEDKKMLETEDVVSAVITQQAGRLKMIRKDGVASPLSRAMLIEATSTQTVADKLNEWADQNADKALMVFDITALSPSAILVIYSKEINERQRLVLERHGREISAKVSEMTKNDIKNAEEQVEKEEKEQNELKRLAKQGKLYEERLIAIKKLPDSKEKKQLFRELENGGANIDLMFESLRKLVRAGGDAANMAQMLADQLGFGGMLRYEASVKDDEAKKEESPSGNHQE